jgi:hypothetical protein
MILGKIVFDHRPPLALRAEGDDANDPDRIVAICRTCEQRKTPRDLREIARTKRIARNHQDFLDRMRDKVPGRAVPSRSQWRKLLRRIGVTSDALAALNTTDGSAERKFLLGGHGQPLPPTADE